MLEARRPICARIGVSLLGLVFALQAQAQVDLFFPPQAIDRPEFSYTDSNGDGIDGMRRGPVFVSRFYGDDANTGEIHSPLKTIGVGICVAEALGGRPIYVERGYYFESLVPFPNTEIFGAYSDFYPGATSWLRSTTINSNVVSGDRCPVFVPNVGSRFVFEACSAIAEGTNWRPAMYLVDPSGGSVSLVGSQIIQRGKGIDGTEGAWGANGGIGLNGGNGGNGTSGLSGTNVAGGSQGLGAKFSGANPRNGGNGGGGGWADSSSWYRGYNGEAGGGNGGARGSGGNPGASHWSLDGADGTAGSAGAAAPDGANGVASTALFGGNGGDGMDGSPGNGGGGGGGGGSYLAAFVNVLTGGGGGGGGAGGGFGKGGRGGTAGGPLFGLVWLNTASSTLNLTSGLVSVTNGGKGGNAGFGGTGGTGGTGGQPGNGKVESPFGRSGKGGVGGAGSNGGRGGGGAGGRGGASVGIIAPSLVSGQLQGGTYEFPNGAAEGGIGSDPWVPETYGLPGALLNTHVGTNYPNVESGIPADAPRLLASAARVKTAVGKKVTFRPIVMTRNGGTLPANSVVTVKSSANYRGTFVDGPDFLYTYTPNVVSGPTPNYEEPFFYEIAEPLYDAQGNYIRHNKTTWKGIISVCYEATISVQLKQWSGPVANSTAMPTIVEPAERDRYALPSAIPIVNGGTDKGFTFLVPNESMPLRVKYGHWLSQVVAPNVLPGPKLQYSFNLTNGDCDGDNVVGLFDYLLLSAAFDSTPGDPTWNSVADLDGDGVVSLFDYLILSESFDGEGQ